MGSSDTDARLRCVWPGLQQPQFHVGEHMPARMSLCDRKLQVSFRRDTVASVVTDMLHDTDR